MIVVLRFSDLIIDLFMLNSKLLRIIITTTNDLTAATEMIPSYLETITKIDLLKLELQQKE